MCTVRLTCDTRLVWLTLVLHAVAWHARLQVLLTKGPGMTQPEAPVRVLLSTSNIPSKARSLLVPIASISNIIATRHFFIYLRHYHRYR